MSRRLATVLRVAALQERLAKAQAGQAAVAVDRAEQEHTDRLAELAAARLSSGLSSALTVAQSTQSLRARAAGASLVACAQARDGRAASLEAWTAARARHRLLEELDARLAQEQQAEEISQAQRLADDLSGARRAVSR